jgi:putative ABC transport system permease protein
MLLNYFTVALRNLRKNRLFSALNIAGLSLGLAACLLIALYVGHELSYDRWNPNAERIVRPISHINFGSTEYRMAVVSASVGPDCAREMPEVAAFCRFRQYGSFLIKREGDGQQNFKEENVLFADSAFFQVFPRQVLACEASQALTRPATLALSKSTAEKYFGSVQAAVGQSLVLENRERWQVSAVFEDLPAATHFKADFLLAMNGNPETKEAPTGWASNNNWETYLLLQPGVTPEAFTPKFEALTRQKMTKTVQQLLGTSLEDFERTGQFARYPLQKLTDIHLYSDLTVELGANGSIQHVWIFGSIAGFILLIACINFMNLSTARSAGRAREVGVRKSLGSGRGALIRQFLIESGLLAAISVALAVGVTAAVLPWFCDLTDRNLTLPLGEPAFWGVLAGATVVVGLLAGSYPAFFLSAFNAVRVLKGEVAGLGKGGLLRSALVVFQFTASVALITATLLVYRQLNFIQNKRVGFDRSQVVILHDAYALGDKMDAFKNQMQQVPAVESASTSGFLPVPSNRSDQGFWKTPSTTATNSVQMQRWKVDFDYLRTLGMELANGRNFDRARPADSSTVILNETAARLFGLQGDPVGQKIYTLDEDPGGVPTPEDFVEMEVIGVVKDFHFASLRDNIGALCLQLGPARGLMTFRFKGQETSSVLAALEKNWQSLAPGQPFSYEFLDDAFAEMYSAEQRVGTIAGVFALLSVLISCLGLFGLASFTTERRTKEIGVRKVLGASVLSITSLLAKDFLKLVVVAIGIASPVAYYFSSQWLADFAYHIDIQWWVFVLAGLVAVLIAFATVSFQSVRAALANPVKSLRSE